MTPMQTRLAVALHRLTDLPLKDCQAFLAEDEWDMRRAVARMHAYRWLSGLTPAAWERFRQDLHDCGVADVALPG
jgi:hypothetical protein